jgi:hypothetical protein
MSLFWIGPTELRIVLAVGTLTLAVRPAVDLFGQSVRLFDVGGVCAIAGLLVALIVSAVSNTRTLYRAEPRPTARP